MLKAPLLVVAFQMLRGLFRPKTPLTPLTDHCVKLSMPDTLSELAHSMPRPPSSIDARAVVLSMVIMAAAGDFMKELRWETTGEWRDSAYFLRSTNLDRITAETLVWLSFLMRQFWFADRTRDPKMFELIGLATVKVADERVIPGFIKDFTGVAFADRRDRGTYYRRAMQTKTIHKAFTSVVLRSVGCRSLLSPEGRIVPQPPEWTPLKAYVTTFFLTKPEAFYDTFKSMLLACPDRFA